MIRIPGIIPIEIYPFFWAVAALIGWLNSATWQGTLVWVGIIFVSVLLHEMGHALTALLFRQHPTVRLIAFGGLTTYEGKNLTSGQQFLIVLNGPLMGILLFFIAGFLVGVPSSPSLRQVLVLTQVANLFWSVINLLPVMPLDGGQLLRIALEGFFGIKGFRFSLFLSGCIASAIAVVLFYIHALIGGAFFFFFAFQGFDAWRKTKSSHAVDRQRVHQDRLTRAEELLKKGEKAQGYEELQAIRKEFPGSMLAAQATQYLALLEAEEGKIQEAYDLLLPIQKHLSEEGKYLLFLFAAEKGDDRLASELGAACYRRMPTREIALCNAKVQARLGNAKAAGGWLQTAWHHQPFEVEELVEKPDFDKVRDEAEFKKFVWPLR